MTVNVSSPADLQGLTVVGSGGDKLGKVDEVYLDNETGKPEWVSVKTGFFGSNTALVPVAAADLSGDTISVPFSKAMVKDAPHSDPGHEISEADEAELFTYYGIPYGGDTVTATGGPGQAGYTDTTPTTGTPYTDTTQTTGTGYTETAPTAGVTDRTDTVGHDTSGPNTDDAMTRSEEQLHVGTEARVAGKARLRKYITSETVTQTVPVSREKVTVEREAITDANRGAALSGGDLTEEVQEVTLTEERPIAVKETVPVERVKLGTETVTEQATVSDELHKENIEVEGVDGTTTRTNER